MCGSWRALVAMLALAVLAGCAPDASPAAIDETVPAHDAPRAADDDHSDELLVLGRSVMTGWMAHWGGDAQTSASWEGHAITFREIEGPPGIGASAASAIGEAPAGSLALFKFCFVDFNGGEYAEELDAYESELVRVADAADAEGVRLILGTALPKVRSETTPELVAEHQAFGAMVEALAADRREAGQDVVVLDLNDVLADDDGALEARYALARDDSHLNEAAYRALDEALLPLLAR